MAEVFNLRYPKMFAAAFISSLSTPLLILIVLAIVLGGAALVFRLIQKEAGTSSPGQVAGLYAARPAILSPAERSFAGVLDGALPDGVTWFAKVRVGDIVV